MICYMLYGPIKIIFYLSRRLNEDLRIMQMDWLIACYSHCWRIFNSFMNGFYMLLKITWSSCLVITLLARMFNSFMDGPDMLDKATWCSYLVIAILARIFNSFVFRKTSCPWFEKVCHFRLNFSLIFCLKNFEIR